MSHFIQQTSSLRIEYLLPLIPQPLTLKLMLHLMISITQRPTKLTPYIESLTLIFYPLRDAWIQRRHYRLHCLLIAPLILIIVVNLECVPIEVANRRLKPIGNPLLKEFASLFIRS